MTLIRQIWLVLVGVLLFALIGSLAVHALTARQQLRTQLAVRNDEAATMLALALAQQQGDTERMRLLVTALFDTGHYHQLRLLRMDGSVLFERASPVRPTAAPAWFARMLALRAQPGVAQVFDGTRPIASVQLSRQPTMALDALWDTYLQAAGWLSLLGLAACALALTAVRSWRRPIQDCVAQAQALEDGRFVIATESRVPELRRLTHSMNALVRRLQGVFESQTQQLEELRAQAHLDPVTRVLNRRQFVAQLGASLGAERQRGAGLLLVRLRRLEDMNRRIGHDATDRLLAALAQVLQSYPRRVKGALAGRLNGSDFALYLPAVGMAAETARSLVEALRAALAAVDQGAELVIGGAELPHAGSAAAALSTADGALAQAEGGAPFGVEIHPGLPADRVVLGEQQWHASLAAALQAGRARLAEFPVCGPDGELLHLDCPMRLQLQADGPFEPASRWLAMAVRCRLVSQVDLAALSLALDAMRRDGQGRCVNVAAASLASAGFVHEFQQRLQAAPIEAARLSVDFAEGALLNAKRLGEAAVLWQQCGVRIGLEHAGARLRELSRLHALGVDYIKIDGAFVQGAATAPAVRDLARGLVGLLRGMDVQVLAQAVEDEADLAVLWALGFDGATGPAVRRS